MPWTLAVASLAVLVVAAALVALAYRRRWTWTGFTGASASAEDPPAASKTLWDWLGLLGVPVALALVVFFLNSAQSRHDRALDSRRAGRDKVAAADARQADTLRAYLQQMSDLVLKYKLSSTRLRPFHRKPSAQAVARALTIGALRQLDGRRKGLVVEYLSDAGLIDSRDPKVDLTGADLQHAVLTSLERADLEGADLRWAHFEHSHVGYVDVGRSHPALVLDGADLRHASFRRAGVFDASFYGADLRDADFSGAELGSAPDPHEQRHVASQTIQFARSDMRGTRFRRTRLGDVLFDGDDLRQADFYAAAASSTDFSGSCLSGAAFIRATLERAVFLQAEGAGLDFSRADLASSLFGPPGGKPIDATAFRRTLATGYARLTGLNLQGARTDGASFPAAWSPTGLSLTRAQTAQLCADMRHGVDRA